MDLRLSGTYGATYRDVGLYIRRKGQMSIKDRTKTTLDVVVEVNDAALAPDPNDDDSLSISITDVNEPPTVALTNTLTSLPEDTNTSSAIKVADIVITDDALGTRDLSLSGADATMFEIVGLRPVSYTHPTLHSKTET